jgi:hypothetical protein
MSSGARLPGHAGRADQAGRLILSCGGYRSGSTFCYNLVGEYVERAGSGRRIGYIEPSQVPLLSGVWSFFTAMDVAVGKSHDSPGTAAGAEVWPGLLADAATPVLPICTVRDFRDVLHSFSRKFAESPEEVLGSRRWRINQDNLRWWLSRGAFRVHYEDLVATPDKVLEDVALAAGLPVRACLLSGAVEAAGHEPATQLTAGLARQAVDGRTLLHADHLSDPFGGGWRRWGTERLERLRPRLEPLLEEFGYVW